ncbi:Fe(2+) transporter permease subunit FeoB [Thiocystis violascens]|uniref:Ferrous iron transport protein B n=1 Tax=Thiocystis violascens (strain ATCC 17096 / DSM 198 / 6111) TaxID=765911 RepID=I3YAA1_THIV6|nr:Fe(2+) transporter permease subunit FeoB [Thiocystis violascens]AFL73919.1 ferrous iron transporter FeoB [Thiocystis violascens DSM 198]
MNQTYTIGVVGNPNCGKTTLFNALTGARQRVGNWPGVTVERKTGRYRFGDTEFTLVDLPGTYSLDVSEQSVSLDERIARDFVHAREADLILNILDATSLERNLYLTTQLIEMGRPLVLALNMMDTAAERGLRIEVAALSARLGCPVVPIVAASGKGLDALRQTLLETAAAARGKDVAQPVGIHYGQVLEDAIAALLPRLTPIAVAQSDPPRWLASRLLEGDDLARSLVGDRIGQNEIRALLGDVADDVDILLADARYGFAHAVVQAAVSHSGTVSRNFTDRVDRVMLNRALGIPIFLVVMYLMFMFTINIGGAFIDVFDQAAGTIFVDGTAFVLAALGTPDWLIVGLADGIGGGIQVVATFIPIIAFLYLFMSVLEDSGYMARAAFVMDRFMRAVGLPGKSFVPLLVGFGCNVPAIMAARTLENSRDRILTVLMAPFMSCGARLPVYALFAAAFFPVGGQNIVFALYLIGIAAAMLTGFILKRTLLEGQTTPFVMELPPYHLPTIKGVLLRTWDRTSGFVVRAGSVIVPMVLVINVLNTTGTDGSFGNEDSERSVLASIGRTMAPAFAPMGLDAENWPATVGIFTGILAKEAVVGTLDATYSALGNSPDDADTEAEPYSLLGGLSAALATVPVNLVDALGGWTDPMGLGIGDVSDLETAAAEQAVTTGTFGAMASRFDGAAGAFAYLLFILLYAPCVAAIAAIARETSTGWAIFAAAWTTGLGYLTATVFYQTAIFARDPASSAAWIGGMLAILIATTIGMRAWARRGPVAPALARDSL